ncbi:MAG: PD-(D/E)XK nuclease family protein [Treponema sp.]|nr:PD-(D/E)XK nuclease family protein [Treponema sp.]
MNAIEKVLKEHILNKSSVFIFNTDVAANSWTDFIVRQDGKDGWPQSVALDRFLAWDAFKGQTLKIERQGFESIPSLLRKLFARGLLERIKNGEPIFERLINSDYKENALSFTDWISGLLPSLGRWRILAQKFMQGGTDESGAGSDACDGESFIGERDNPENRDFLRLYQEYSKFLEERKLFEPSWQKAVFDPADNKTYIIFFPELLDDFDEYKEVLEGAQKSGKVILVEIPKSAEPIKADYWTSARLELRMTALKILKAQKDGTDWNDMALCVPDIENYRPYVERELELYQIPFVTRSGIKLGTTGAGRIFRKIQDCVQQNFSYKSVRALVLDSNFPWKNPQEMETLVRLGKEYKCLAQYTDSKGKLVDPWLVDLDEGVRKDGESLEFLNALEFYKKLKKSLQKISSANSFAKIKNAWKEFESAFIKPQEEIQEAANNILSRCVAVMDQLIALEEKFPDLAIGNNDNYSFFLNEAENTQYQTQSKKRGVAVYDYKVSALAAIKKQFVINASQDKITVEKIPLAFLSPKERGLLLDDAQADHSEAYVRSYAHNSDCVFSAAQKALDGFAIPHSALATDEDPRGPDEELDKGDFVKIEKDFLADKKNPPRLLTDAQKAALDNYATINGDSESMDPIKDNQENKDFLLKPIEQKTKIERGKKDKSENLVHLTPSDLRDFFPCPRKWIFKDLLRVNEFSLDTDLFENYDQGSVNHKTLEMYFKDLKDKGLALPTFSESSGKIALQGDEDYEEKILFPLLENLAFEAFKEAASYKKSALVKEALKSQNKIFAQAVVKFLRDFCKEENFGGWKIVETEWGQGKDATLGPVLQGRMDLVLRSPENQIAIIDYKNSSASFPQGNLNQKKQECNPDGSPKELDDCQIAAYVYLWQNANPNKEDKVQKASFVSIKKCEEKKVIDPNARGNAVSCDDFDAATQSLKRLLLSMDQSLQSGRFSLKDVKPYKHCVNCDYKHLCRTTY